MKLYRVISFDYGASTNGRTVVGTGHALRAFTSQADALREYNRRKRELENLDVRYSIHLHQLEMPAMTAELWIQALESDSIPYTVTEHLRHERRTEVAA